MVDVFELENTEIQARLDYSQLLGEYSNPYLFYLWRLPPDSKKSVIIRHYPSWIRHYPSRIRHYRSYPSLTTNRNAVGIFLVSRVTEISKNWFFVLVNPITGYGAGGSCGIQEGLLEPACLNVVAIHIPSGIGAPSQCFIWDRPKAYVWGMPLYRIQCFSDNLEP